MPNIAITPKFTPFTYEELARPLVEATQYQMALEDQYNNLAMKTAELDYLKDSDDEAWQAVKNYEQGLRDAAGTLMSNGLTPQSRQDLYNLRTRYQSEISPINKYVAWRQAQDKARQEIMAKDPTYRWEVPLDQVKYNTWRDNPDMLFRGTSGDALAKMAQTSIQHITKKWREDADFQKLNTIGLEDYWQKIENYGLNVEDMLTLRKAIENSSKLTDAEKKVLENKMNKAAIDIRDQVINSTDIPQWSNYKDLEDSTSPLSMWVNSNIERGLWAGIGEQKDQILQDGNTARKTGGGNGSYDLKFPELHIRSIAGAKNPDFISSYDKAINGLYTVSDIINNINDYMSNFSFLPYTAFNAAQYANISRKAATTATVKLIKDKAGRNLTDTNALAGIIKDIYNTVNYDNDYKTLIDDELKKEKSDIIRKVDTGDNSNPSYAHKVEVPAIVAMTWELVNAGNNEDRVNMILNKYRSMPLERTDKIEIIDKNKYKKDYTVSEIEKAIGDNAANKIQQAYNMLKNFKPNADDDLGIFNVYYDVYDNETLESLLRESIANNSYGEDYLYAYDYKWNDEEQDFEAYKTDNKIDNSVLIEGKPVDVEYSGRDVFLNVLGKDNKTYKIQAYVGENVKNKIEKCFEEIKEYSKDVKNILNMPPEEFNKNADKYIEDYNLARHDIKTLYTKVMEILSNAIRKKEATKEKI